MHNRSICLVAALSLIVFLAACGGEKTQSVVLYSSVDEVFARPIAEKFQQETGIEVRLVPDTEETKSTGLLNRLIAEKDRPQADVFWSGDPVRAALLKQKQVSAPYRPAAAADLPQHVSDPEGYWSGFSTRARVLIYNRNLIPAGQEPKSVLDLANPRFKGKATLANPLFGTTSMHAAALFAVLGEDKAKAFFEEFLRNEGTIVSSNGEVRRRVADGDFAIGLTDTDDANVARLEGKPIGIVYPDHDGMGTLLVPNCAVLIANGPNPEAGRRFIDYLLQPDTERALAESEAAQIPLRSGVPTPPEMVRLADLKPMAVDYSNLATLLEGLSAGYLKDWVDRGLR
jgi:iron(III) transport system substrate-binding protein